MTATPKLELPLLAAAQAQKHVTHNEALMALDALVHLSLKSRTELAPPPDPEDQSAYLVPDGAGGGFAGQDGRIATYIDGQWLFRTPRAGWLAFVESESAALVCNGTGWQPLGEGGGGATPALLGINTVADTTTRFAVAAEASLFTGDTGDHRLKINRSSSNDTASMLFQTGFSAVAEFGLTGDSALHLRHSADGSNFDDAMVVDTVSGQVAFPAVSGAVGGDYLINGDFSINQRGFAGGALADGNFGFDRWKAVGASSLSLSGGSLTLASGKIRQVIEAPELAGETVVVSLDDPTGDIAVELGSASGTIPAGSGRQAVRLTLGGGDSGNVALSLSAVAGSVGFARVKLELAPVASRWRSRRAGEELFLCQRYYRILTFNLSTGSGSGTQSYSLPITPPMAYTPSATRVGNVVSNGETGTTQIVSTEVNNSSTFGVYNSGTGVVGGKYLLEAEL
ncbi:uncharacterized protein DUF2793 [Hoeflea halophila]|uniref:Uncharacterized protein DUF2793 n=1 Tax=Hoeflea halophila TaxID=714899 RepID=A0A286ICH5_9HYPH|nr:DUF2793 domain-containing protein [Hoeflea halophila]SOE17810.1 uncharacterized protein DUF2793 [Hoeflea halophila]